jgi:methylated-DNA-protein-cysteine methyltransferase related protein
MAARQPSPRHRKIVAVIVMVPKGKVASYGQIAKLAGFPGQARQVVWTLHSSSKRNKLPWHRIINSQGKIGLADEYRNRQRLLLEKEGVEFDQYGKIDLKAFGWKPSISLLRKKLSKAVS